jgi:galactose oxidase
VGQVLKFSADKHIGSASLVRQGTTTHTVNTDQRRVPLELNAHDGHSFTANLPDDAGILLPGWYMLFALDAEGTPSEASLVKVELSQFVGIELEEMLENDSDQEDVEYHVAHEECDEEKMMGMLSAIISSPVRVWKSWKPLLVMQGN